MLSLILGLKQLTGRCRGRILVRHRGGGVKNKYRLIDFNRSISHYLSYKVMELQYDPNRTVNLALILYSTGIFSYIGGSIGMARHMIFGGPAGGLGTIQFLKSLRRGVLVNSVSLGNFSFSAAFIRAAGTTGLVLGPYFSSYMLVKLPSRKHRLFFSHCTAFIGQNSNNLWRFTNKMRAGVSRRLNTRPSVRGVAMNPVDHPHGGGEGKSSGGRHPVSP